jgi:hypothetical protein
MKIDAEAENDSWYREPMVWLLIAVLAMALAAGVTLLSFALLHPDAEVYNERRPAPTVTHILLHGIEESKPA